MFTEKEERLKSIIHLTHTKLYGLLYSLCKDRHIAVDIVQQVYIRVWENLDNIDHDDKIFPLLKKYSRNIFLNELKRSQIRQKAYDSFSEEELDISGEEKLLNKEQYNLIQAAISKLPAQQQKIFRLHKEQALSHKQIAAILNISIGSIEKQMNRALKFLRNELDDMKNDSYALTLILIYLITMPAGQV